MYNLLRWITFNAFYMLILMLQNLMLQLMKILFQYQLKIIKNQHQILQTSKYYYIYIYTHLYTFVYIAYLCIYLVF